MAAAPTVSAMTAPPTPSGFANPTVRQGLRRPARAAPAADGTQLVHGQRFLRWRRAWRKNRSVRPLVAIVLKLEA
jgi:hypothetical protein